MGSLRDRHHLQVSKLLPIDGGFTQQFGRKLWFYQSKQIWYSWYYCLFMFICIYICCLYTYTGVQHYFHAGCPFFCHCIVCPSLNYGFLLPLWYLQTFGQCIVCHFWSTASDYPFGIFKLFVEELDSTNN